MDIYYRSLAPENWTITGGVLQASQLQLADASTKAYCFLSPVTLASLGGTLNNTLSPSTIAASTMMKNSLHSALTASDYTAASWASNGWESESIEIFRGQVKSWIDNNLPTGSILNVGSTTINAYILEKVSDGVRYLLPVIYVGNRGTVVSPVTQNITLNYTTPLFNNLLNPMYGSVTDNGAGVGGVLVTAQIKTLAGIVVQTKTATSSTGKGAGAFTINFTGNFISDTYYLTWSGTVNGQEINKTRIISILADNVPTSAQVSINPTPTVDLSPFTATLTVLDQYSNPYNEGANVSLTYNGTTQSGITDVNGQFQATFTASVSATTVTYSGDVSGSQAITVQAAEAAQVQITQSPTPAVDGASFTVTATVLNAQSTPVGGKTVSITYNGTTQTGTSDGSGQYQASFTTDYEVTTVSYSVDSLTGSSSITTSTAAQVVTSITLGEPSVNPVDTNSAFTISATVYDQYNTPMAAGTSVTIVDSMNATLGSGSTNSSGVATISCTSPSVASTYTITAKSGSVTSNTQSLIVNNPTLVVTTVNISAPSSTPIFTGGSTVFTATVFDQFSNPMNNVSVSFFDESLNLVGSDTTDSSGEATYTFTPSTSGSFTFTAEASAVTSSSSSPVTVNAAPFFNQITLGDPSPSTVFVGGAFDIEVNTYDQYGSAFSNVSFTIFDNENNLLGNGTTDALGYAQITCTAVSAGNLTLQANSGSITSNLKNLTVSILAPTNLEITVPAQTSVLGTFSVSATVTDQLNSPMSGVTVVFQNSEGSVSGVTNGSGVATVSLTAASAPGVDTVTAVVGDLSDSGSIEYTALVITINSLTSSPVTAISGEATLTVSASVTGDGTILYQWQKQENGTGSFSDVAEATSSTLNLSGLTFADDNGDVYRVVLNATGASQVTSTEVTLSVAAPPVTPTVDSVTVTNTDATTAEIEVAWSGPAQNYELEEYVTDWTPMTSGALGLSPETISGLSRPEANTSDKQMRIRVLNSGTPSEWYQFVVEQQVEAGQAPVINMVSTPTQMDDGSQQYVGVTWSGDVNQSTELQIEVDQSGTWIYSNSMGVVNNGETWFSLPRTISSVTTYRFRLSNIHGTSVWWEVGVQGSSLTPPAISSVTTDDLGSTIRFNILYYPGSYTVNTYEVYQYLGSGNPYQDYNINNWSQVLTGITSGNPAQTTGLMKPTSNTYYKIRVLSLGQVLSSSMYWIQESGGGGGGPVATEITGISVNGSNVTFSVTNAQTYSVSGLDGFSPFTGSGSITTNPYQIFITQTEALQSYALVVWEGSSPGTGASASQNFQIQPNGGGGGGGGGGGSAPTINSASEQSTSGFEAVILVDYQFTADGYSVSGPNGYIQTNPWSGSSPLSFSVPRSSNSETYTVYLYNTYGNSQSVQFIVSGTGGAQE